MVEPIVTMRLKLAIVLVSVYAICLAIALWPDPARGPGALGMAAGGRARTIDSTERYTVLAGEPNARPTRTDQRAIEGVIVCQHGVPLADFPVAASSLGPRAEPRVVTRTDARGRFRFGFLSSPHYRIRAPKADEVDVPRGENDLRIVADL